ncbi:uncharacterized protein K02A2.6-like [Ochlerotatus camptorhynchus]|uniref:uncharacterized protein K02A2.6-like n=1 Tax=Ochlerotatus camptorhynchus TaxID=644619 RepID=UPI0031DCC2FC
MKIGSNSNVSEPCLVEVIIQGRRLMMEIDTGSAVAVISKTLYRKLFDSIVLTKCNKKLVVVNGSKLAVAGQLLVKVSLNGRSSLEKLVILNTESDFTSLLGRDWMESFYPEWKLHFLNPGVINHLGFDTFRENAIGNIKQKYFKVFSKDFCEPISGFKADLTFKSEQPIFKRAYQVPYKLKEKFLNHLDMLEQQGVITAIKASEWASPVIAILKKDGDIRMISLSGHKLTAHRNQLKMAHTPRRQSKVFVSMGMPASKKRHRSVSDEEDLLGFPDVPMVPEDVQTLFI